MIRRYRWSGPQPARCEEQIANAPDGLFAFAPASGAPAEGTRSNWSALLPGQAIPLIWEDSRYGYQGREDRC